MKRKIMKEKQTRTKLLHENINSIFSETLVHNNCIQLNEFK